MGDSTECLDSNHVMSWNRMTDRGPPASARAWTGVGCAGLETWRTWRATPAIKFTNRLLPRPLSRCWQPRRRHWLGWLPRTSPVVGASPLIFSNASGFQDPSTVTFPFAGHASDLLPPAFHWIIYWMGFTARVALLYS